MIGGRANGSWARVACPSNEDASQGGRAEDARDRGWRSECLGVWVSGSQARCPARCAAAAVVASLEQSQAERNPISFCSWSDASVLFSLLSHTHTHTPTRLLTLSRFLHSGTR